MFSLSRLMVAALFTATLSHGALAQKAQSASEGPDVATFTLENGLQVVVIPDHRAPVVTHMIWYKAGAADEPEGESGIAHFLEHLMFKGTKEHPGGAFSAMVSELGGQENAFTSQDYTAYYQRVAKENLATVMEFEADRMTNLVLTDEVVDPERNVVLEERRMRIDNDPSSRLSEAVAATLFVNHPYGTPIIGWNHEIEKLDRHTAMRFYERFYTPNNAILVVAGDVTRDEVRGLAEQTYGKIARRQDIGPRLRPVEPDMLAARRVTLADPRAKQPSLTRTYIVPSYANAEGRTAHALDVMAFILGGGSTSRLHRALVSDQSIAASAGAYYQGDALDQSRFMVYAIPRENVSIDRIEAAMDAELARIAKEGVSADELKRAQKRLVAETIYAQDSQTTLARAYGSTLTTGGTVDDVKNWPAEIEAVTLEEVQAAAKLALQINRSVTGVLLTEEIAPQ